MGRPETTENMDHVTPESESDEDKFSERLAREGINLGEDDPKVSLPGMPIDNNRLVYDETLTMDPQGQFNIHRSPIIKGELGSERILPGSALYRTYPATQGEVKPEELIAQGVNDRLDKKVELMQKSIEDLQQKIREREKDLKYIEFVRQTIHSKE